MTIRTNYAVKKKKTKIERKILYIPLEIRNLYFISKNKEFLE